MTGGKERRIIETPNKKECVDMGQTDKQFAAFLRSVILNLKKVKRCPTVEDMRDEIDEIIEYLQTSIED